MSQNIGTLITSAIRPNDSDDPIASVFSNEVKGGNHSVDNIPQRNSIIFERRNWGMLCYVKDDDKTYQLKHNLSDNDIMNNFNWGEVPYSEVTKTDWVLSVDGVVYEEPQFPQANDRYLVGLNPSDTILGTFSSLYSPGVIVESDSISWKATIPTDGMSVRLKTSLNEIYNYVGEYPNGKWNREKLNQNIPIEATTLDGGYTYEANSPVELTQYESDIVFLCKFDDDNIGLTASGGATQSIPTKININGIGLRDIKKIKPNKIDDLDPQDVSFGPIYTLLYDSFGDYFQLVKNFSENNLSIKNEIQADEYIIIPPFHQYWIYGDLDIKGTLVNYGNLSIANGSMNLTGLGNFINEGTFDLIDFTIKAGDGIEVDSNNEISVKLENNSGLFITNTQGLEIDVDDKTIKKSNNKIFVNGNSIHEYNFPNVTSGVGQPSGILITNTPISYSSVKVFVNGQAQTLGGAQLNKYQQTECYFSNGVVVRDINEIESGDELYWNSNIAEFDLDIDDKILLIYEIE